MPVELNTPGSEGVPVDMRRRETMPDGAVTKPVKLRGLLATRLVVMLLFVRSR